MPVVVGALCLLSYVLVYRFYARYLARRVFQLDDAALTPAHRLRDDMDYVPTRRSVLLGHHYASIAGLSPMLGPAIAVIWGWLPALLWVVLGTLFIGAVHDFSALVLSMRARGMSIGKVAEDVIGPRARSLFHAIIFFLIALGMGVFVHVVALLFTASFYPQAVLPTFGLMAIAVGVGVLVFRRGAPLGPLSVTAFLLTLALIGISLRVGSPDLALGSWKWILLGYAFLASVLPVWLLLQPRDYVNSMLLYLGLAAAYVGFFALGPSFQAPAITASPAGAPPLFPFVFIVIACGAVSGFHALVSSGTTAKQIDRETDAPLIGYGGMVGESLLGLLAVLACTAGFSDRLAWQNHYADWSSASDLGDRIGAFIAGTAKFVGALGVPEDVGAAFIALVVVSFALTSLDSATRLLRFNLAEVGEAPGLGFLRNRFAGSLLACAAIAFFAFYQIGGRAAGLALWQLFGTTNQVLGGLTL
ncbi:MAG: carbon starvation protein A, partial [Gemmatimonadetes bacterium]|nr:carbon starvation protein A [Gemmatimonadota bacterium]